MTSLIVEDERTVKSEINLNFIEPFSCCFDENAFKVKRKGTKNMIGKEKSISIKEKVATLFLLL